MAYLEHRLVVKLTQKTALTPGLVQMVSLLALNKLELVDMISEELAQNPVLEEATEREDRHGRTLAYLATIDGRSIQAQLLREGLASAVAVSPNLRHLRYYAEAESNALTEKRGIWGLSYYRARAAGSKAATRGGYTFVFGEVQRIEISDRWFVFTLAKHFVILVPRADWARYFDYPPCSLDRAQIAVRGWVSTRGKRSRVVIKHPFMLERCGRDPAGLCPDRTTARQALPAVQATVPSG